MTRRLLLPLLLALAVVAGGCTRDDPAVDVDGDNATNTTTDDDTTSTTRGSATTSDGGGSDGGGELEGASTTRVSVPAPGRRGVVTGVQVGRHDGFDRIVFTFREGEPGYVVEYVDGDPVADGSGEPIRLLGDQTLLIRMEDSLDADENGQSTYSGSPRVAGAGGPILEAVRVGGFEGVLTWAVGTNSKHPFKVTVQRSPSTKLIVDVAAD